MSLLPSLISPVPEQTVRIARAAFPKGNLYLKLRDNLGTLFDDRDFIELFSKRGHPSHAPWRLALITLMQFLENLSDRQAAEAVRSRIDWKYLLGLELSDSGFDHSVLSGWFQIKSRSCRSIEYLNCSGKNS
jgi:transposase